MIVPEAANWTAAAPAAPLCLPGLPEGQRQRDGNDGQRARKLDDGGARQHGAARAVQGVPGGGRRRDGRGVVHRRAGKQGKAFIAQPQLAAQPGEQQGGQHIEEEDD